MKIKISLILSLVVAAWFTVNKSSVGYYAIISSLAIIGFAAPSYVAIYKSKRAQQSIAILIGLYFFAILFETFAIKTGWPYGSFYYGDSIGYRFFNTTPWTVGFAFPPILLLAYYVGQKLHQKKLYLYLVAGITAMLVDMVLDPAATTLKLWTWEKGGQFYGVPLQNFVGWVIAGFIGAIIIHQILKNGRFTNAVGYSGLLILWFWTWVNIFLGQIIPFLIGIVLSVIFYYVVMTNRGTIVRWQRKK